MMRTKNKVVHGRIWLVLGILVLACYSSGTPVASVPQPVPPTQALVGLPLEPSPTPFQPATSTLPPPAIATDTLVPSFTPTSTTIPSPTYTPLPPLPDFGQFLNFGEGGGAGHTCMAPLFPPPVVYGDRGTDGSHVAGLCVYKTTLPVNAPIHLTLTSPDGVVILQGNFQGAEFVQPYWLGFEYMQSSLQNNNYADGCKEGSCAYWGVEFWWPANMPKDTWQVHLTWNGGEAFGAFDANLETTLPEFSVQDALATSTLRPSASFAACHPVSSSQGLSVAGRGFPSNTLIYVPIFEHVADTQYRFLSTQVLISDANGYVSGPLNGAFQSGKRYAIAGVTDATRSFIAPDGSGGVTFVALEDGADCFLVP